MVFLVSTIPKLIDGQAAANGQVLEYPDAENKNGYVIKIDTKVVSKVNQGGSEDAIDKET